MSTNKLAQVIRKIVREEVRKEVRHLLNEQSKPKVTSNNPNTGLKHALGLNTSSQRRVKKPKAVKQYTKNKMLNDILNETANHISTGNADRLSGDVSEYPSMGGGSHTSGNAQAFGVNSLAAKMGYGDVNQGAPSLQEMVPSTDTRGMMSKGVAADSAVAKALTRDYSELVKTFKK